MKLDLIASSKNDEYHTPEYAVHPILQYVPTEATVWCPFDRKESAYVRLLQERGNTVIYTHIKDGVDFFEIQHFDCDFIISNPPYSLKTPILERLFETGKPFAMLLCVVGIFESQKRFHLFRSNDFEIMYFNRRISFRSDSTALAKVSHPPFSSVYICRGVLPEKIIFEALPR